MKSGEPIILPAGTHYSKSGKAKMHGMQIKPGKENEEVTSDHGKKKKKKGSDLDRNKMFERHLESRAQQRNLHQLRRKLYSTTMGDKTVVAVRVVANGGSYSKSEDHLRNKVFGTNGDSFNLKSGYAQCSNNQLRFNPYPGRRDGNGASIQDGVVTITVDNDVSEGQGALVNAVMTRIQQVFGSVPRNIATYWMLCMPSQAFEADGGKVVV